MSQSEQELKVIEKVTSNSNNESYLKPKRERSKKQIEWSRELGKRSKEFKIKKKEKNYEITTIEETPEIKEVNNKSYIRYYLGFSFFVVISSSVYYLYKLKKNIKPPSPVKQIKSKPTINSMD
jgi:hypothetical protein